jgi:hypothetical protein
VPAVALVLAPPVTTLGWRGRRPGEEPHGEAPTRATAPPQPTEMKVGGSIAAIPFRFRLVEECTRPNNYFWKSAILT